jgi:peptidoglycan/LPS O-acetylase OafA/YrhL
MIHAGEETGRHLDFLDGWRGLAIATVLLGHFFLEGIAPNAGIVGVQLFFVLTGRLMAEILFVRKAPLGRFYVRRVSRVVPALYCFILITSIAFKDAGGGYPVGGKGIFAATTFTINYAMLYAHPVLLFDHLWSLCVEEHSYVLLSIIAVLCARRTSYGAIALALLAVVASANGVVRSELWGEPTLPILWRTDFSVAQIAIAGAIWLGSRTVSFPPYVAPSALIVGLLLALFAATLSLGLVLGTVLLALAIASLDNADLNLRNALSTTPLTQLGKYSFSLYLWQQPFYKLYRYEAAPVWVLFPAAIAAGLASYYLVEKPARRAINNRFDAFISARRAILAPT